MWPRYGVKATKYKYISMCTHIYEYRCNYTYKIYKRSVNKISGVFINFILNYQNYVKLHIFE